jgi:hypothetical protein
MSQPSSCVGVFVFFVAARLPAAPPALPSPSLPLLENPRAGESINSFVRAMNCLADDG